MPLSRNEQALLDRLRRVPHPIPIQIATIARLQRKESLSPIEYAEILAERRAATQATLARLREAVNLPPPRVTPAERRRERIRAEEERITRREYIRVGVLGVGGEPPIYPYVYRRLIEIVPRRGGRRRAGRVHVIRVDSPVPLTGRALEEEFRFAIEDFRRLIRYTGNIWYVTPREVGREAPIGYVPPRTEEYYEHYFDEFDEDIGYFDIPEDLGDEDFYLET